MTRWTAAFSRAIHLNPKGNARLNLVLSIPPEQPYNSKVKVTFINEATCLIANEADLHKEPTS